MNQDELKEQLMKLIQAQMPQNAKGYKKKRKEKEKEKEEGKGNIKAGNTAK